MATTKALTLEAKSLWTSLGREGLSNLVADVSPAENSDEYRLLALLNDPGFQHYSFAALCKESGMTVNRLKELFVNHKLTEGTFKMYQHIPKAMEDAALAATERIEDCPACSGARIIVTADNETVPCQNCKGTGSITLRPDPGARTAIFEAVGLTGKKGGIQIAIQNNVTSSGPPTLESIAKEVQGVIDVTPERN